MQCTLQTLKRKITACSPMYNQCMKIESALVENTPMSQVCKRFPVTSASSVQVHIKALADELPSSKEIGCIT